MITDHSLPHVSQVGPVCDEISVCADIALVTVYITYFEVAVEECSEGLCTEATLQPGVVWEK